MTGAAADRPTFTPGPDAMAHLELILNGACPLTGFMTASETASVAKRGRLPDGTPWPVPVTLPVPDELVAAERVLLTDAEGAPLAELAVSERWWADGGHRLAGEVHFARPPVHGVYRSLRRAPVEVRGSREIGALAHRPMLAVLTDRPLHHRALHQVRAAVKEIGGGGPVEVLVLVDAPFDDEGAVPAVLAAEPLLPPRTRFSVLTLPRAGTTDGTALPAGRAEQLAAHVAARYGASHLLVNRDPDQPPAVITDDSPIPLVAAGEWAYDARTGAWRPAERISAGEARRELTPTEVEDMLGRGEALPAWFTSARVSAELARRRPARVRRGLTLFFTGLSGSGKSTVARGVADAVRRAGRTVTLLDGDVVRRMLSSGLTFSRADRDLNIRRIGYVAAEISRHGGVAVCAPIAPYAATRAEVRAMAEETGDFFLVHVATPLEVCEARDRKGLYAKARMGEIPEFTGISDPYEAPDDADLVIDTSDATEAESVAAVLRELRAGGWLPRMAG
ncbi:adenylyl-sulfate kinase [Marinitenerispora sediminis]|uniref:Adenylyl-sulfate kinase n=1 Tax=Marinitenerispora sediminis TaxID=1931232 RepID=A0A368T3X9_9ACTN|nr:adenylyl-sulfate kinase [Marinitenerispora sediminis]RCV56018.1 adenylyl-sulfate kinase [Marinitenerispora sediminis]RCV57747.1 adenylyl-sulfate kinase [Marinitenerispora sediminis]RCV60994.1 adenylyl-sulfate kinase [Marinitenerispora sediminis]